MSEQAIPSVGEPKIRTQRLSQLDLKRAIIGSRYAIVGTYANQQTNFVNHAALLRRRSSLFGSTDVEVWHMGPPVVAGISTESAKGAVKSIRVQVIGDLVLSESDCEAITNWLAEVEKDYRGHTFKPFDQYVVVPHMVRPPSEEGRRGHRRFSCAGFVIEAYHEVGIVLLDLSKLPDANETELASAYPQLIRLEGADMEKLRERLGFKGRVDLGLTPEKGPWKIALPGYLFHSTYRATPENPRPAGYCAPSTIEAHFPIPEAQMAEDA